MRRPEESQHYAWHINGGSANSRFWMSASISTGLLAWSGGVAAAGKVYVANEDADTVSVLDDASFKVLATVRVGKMRRFGSASFPKGFDSVRMASRHTLPI